MWRVPPLAPRVRRMSPAQLPAPLVPQVRRAPQVRERVRPVRPQVRQQERQRIPLPAARVHEQGPPPATIPPQLAPEHRALQEQRPTQAIATRPTTASFATRSPTRGYYQTQVVSPSSFRR